MIVMLTNSQLRKLSFAIINSTTIVLPAWHAVYKAIGLQPKLIPHDVQTRWNSTYDMLKFCNEYQIAIDAITDKKELGFQPHKLLDEEWDIMKDLVHVLKMLFIFLSHEKLLTLVLRFISRQQFSFLKIECQLLQMFFQPWTGSMAYYLILQRTGHLSFKPSNMH